MKNKKTFILVTTLSLIILAGIGFAYFSAAVVNTNNEKLVTETATLSLKFSDNDNGVGGTLNLGESVVKKFTLENTGTKDAYAKINWVNLINTYNFRSLSYVLEQADSENGTSTRITSELVPQSSIKSNKVLADNIPIPVNKKYYYTLTIYLNDLDTNQNDDVNAIFNSNFSIEESIKDNYTNSAVKTIKNIALKTGNPASRDVIEANSVSQSCINTLAYDGTIDNNLRYVGSNPCNYISFNGELWRIIGVMNNIDDGTGTLNTRLKIVRNESLGNYSWDTSDTNINGGWGVNDWSTSDLMRELNEDYLNVSLNENKYWYNGTKNLKTEIFDYTKVLNNTAQSLMGNAKWYLGGATLDELRIEGFGKASNFYEYERTTKVWGSIPGQTCNDSSCPRSTTWIGKVALIYPSDFGYAIGKNLRNECLDKNMYDFDTNGCNSDNWLKSNNESNWTITTRSDVSDRALDINILCYLGTLLVTGNRSVLPTVYLNPNVLITGGDGSPENPYTLG